METTRMHKYAYIVEYKDTTKGGWMKYEYKTLNL